MHNTIPLGLPDVPDLLDVPQLKDVFNKYNQLLLYCAIATKRFNAKRIEILNIIVRLQKHAEYHTKVNK